jgi:hypothetical protein
MNTEHNSKDDFLRKRHISINEIWEVKYWTQQLHATKSEIKDAINVVGNSLYAVKVYLYNKSKNRVS